jgi:cytochrome P450
MMKSAPPGPAGLPLLGSVFPWLRDQPRFLLETYRRYGEVVRFAFLGFHGAILHGAQANRYLLIDAVDNFQVGPVIDRARARWIVGRGILFIDEPEHRQQRRLILPAMHRKRIEAYWSNTSPYPSQGIMRQPHARRTNGKKGGKSDPEVRCLVMSCAIHDALKLNV